MRIKTKEEARIISSQKIKEKHHWLENLAGELEKTCFPYDHKNLKSVEFLEKIVEFQFPENISSKLLQTSKASDIRLYIILVEAVVILLNKYSASSDIILASPIYKQQIQADFINTVLVLRTRVHQRMTFKELLIQVAQTVKQANENQNYPLEILMEQLNVPLHDNECPLFDTAVLLENIHDKEYIAHLSMNMIFSFTRTDRSIKGEVRYNSQLYKKSTIERIGEHLKNLLAVVLRHPDIRLSQIPILSEEEKHQLLVKFNDTCAGYPRGKKISDLFAEQVKKVPHHTAVTFEHAELTYKELDKQVDHLAGTLKAKGISGESIVGLLLERSLQMIVSILAILKAGGAYMPIDPDYPQERINYMLADSRPKALITTRSLPRLGEMIRKWQGEKIFLEPGHCPGRGEVSSPPSSSTSNPSTLTSTLVCQVSPTNLAYIIYTSGTTGKPKGSLIEHKNVVRLLFNDRFQFDFNHWDVWTMFHSYCFDFSVWEMYGALLYGGKLVMVPKIVARDPAQYLELLKQRRVTILNQTPTAFYNLIAEVRKHPHRALKLRYVIFGGEALNPLQLKEWKEKYPGTKLVNMFGITETTVHVTYKEITDREIRLNISNIGTPIPTLSTYIMDSHLALMPIGAGGELCVAGDGVGRGYLNQPQLTAEKFPPNPYKPHQRLYRSGDLARLLENGEMEYMGRIDHQVKIRGFRVELAEIESQLLKHEKIKEALVLALTGDSGDKSLCAYIVPHQAIEIPELRAYLASGLPDYMIPAYFVQLDAIPITTNGKVDRKALPHPQTAVPASSYIAPRNEIEETLADIWAKELDLERVGIDENYFNIGGDSIRAIKLLNAINEDFNIELKIVDLFTNETIEKFAIRINRYQKDQSLVIQQEEVRREIEVLKARIMTVHPGKEDIEDIYPMSDIEKGMVYYTLKDPGETAYHDQMVYQIRYPQFNPQIFKQALRLLAQKHPILRTSFHMDDYKEPVQIVHKSVRIDMEHLDISNKQRTQQETCIKQCLLEDRQQGFNVTLPPLWRIRTFHLGHELIALLLITHHAVMDGWSVAAFATELNNTYLRLKAEPAFLPGKLKSTYKDFILEQKLGKKAIHTHQYWKKELEDYKRLEFIKKTQDDTLTYVKEYSADIGQELLEQLKTYAQKSNTTIKNMCLAAYIYMLNMLSFENDIAAGIVSSARPVCEDGDKILGCFLNTVPFRVKIPGNITWTQYIEMINQKQVTFETYNKVSLFEILRIIGENPQDINPIFDTIFNYIDFHVFREVEFEKSQERQTQPLSLAGYVKTNTLLDFHVSLTLGQFRVSMNYTNAAFEPEDIQTLCSYFIRILKAFLAHPHQLMNKEAIIAPEDRKKLLYTFNQTEADYPKEEAIHQLFEQQVEQNPDNIALVGKDEGRKDRRIEGKSQELRALTYKELNEKSNQFAYYLKEKGITTDTIVGIMAERSLELIMAILAILKAGGAYLAIESDSPGNRVKYILEDSRARLLLRNNDLNHIPGNMVESLDLENIHTYKAGKSLTNPEQISHPHDLAYVLYTSGSTGNPKGVMVKQAAVVNIIYALQREYPLTAKDVYLMKTSYVFDVSVTEIFGWFLAGGRLALLEKGGEKDPREILTAIVRQGVTHINFVPSMFGAFVNYLEEETGNHDEIATIKYIFLAGEALPPGMVKQFREKNNKILLENIYGPTEATIYASRYSLRHWQGTGSIPIGTPLANITLYILDLQGQLLPPGVRGELCIGGAGLARGYLNNPELTAEKFISISTSYYRSHMSYTSYIPNLSYIYRTGDLARWLPDGSIEFFGRIDRQVKIRGFRIELEEIENQLLKYPNVKETVVIEGSAIEALPGEQDHQYLCAYIVTKESNQNTPPTPTQLKDYLAGKLPGYMIPTYIVLLEQIPLTPSGKIDRKALPQPGEQLIVDDYTPPRNEMEEKIADIWSEILRVEKHKISINSSFFEMGGHSLKLVALASRLHKVLQVSIPMEKLFKNPTIHKQAKYITETAKDKFIPIEPAPKKDYYPLSSAQKRLYILQQMDLTSTGYNIPRVVPLAGQVDIQQMENTFRQLIKRHESLRTSFHMLEKEPVQWIHDQVQFEIEYKEVEIEVKVEEGDNEGTRGLAPLHIISSFIRPFDLSRPPLLRVGLIKLLHTPSALRNHPSQEGKKTKYLLIVDMHHITADAVSLDILIKDFTALEEKKALPPLKLQYKDFSEWQNSDPQKKKLEQQAAYWLEVFSGEIPVLDLPTDNPRPAVQGFEGNSINFALTELEHFILTGLAQKTFTTLYMTIVALFTILLAKLSGQKDIVVGTPVAGRRHADLEGIIGVFINTLAIRSFPTPDKTFNQYLEEVKARTIKAFDNQEYQFEELVERISLPRDISRNPLFDVMFNLLTQEEFTGQNPGIDNQQELSYAYKHDSSKFDLTLTVVEAGKHLSAAFQYSTRLFKSNTINRMIAYFKTLLISISRDTGRLLSGIEIIPASERQQILYDFNDTEAGYPEEKTLQQLFQEQVEKSPQKIALVKHDKKLTFGLLNEKANQLGSRLRQQGVTRDRIIAIFTEPCLEMVTAIIAVLKAGGAYLPIDPGSPTARVRYMLEDSRTHLVLIGPHHGKAVEFAGETIDTADRSIYSGPTANPDHINTPDDLLYTIYTSGTTGKPKGVLIKHKNLVNYCTWISAQLRLSAKDKTVLISSYAFDLGYTAIYTAILQGCELHLISRRHYLEAEELLTYIAVNEISYLKLTPSLFSALAQSKLFTGKACEKLRAVILGGEALDTKDVKQARAAAKHLEFMNHYGPTETTIGSIAQWIDFNRYEEYQRQPTIGKPINNTRVYILDRCLQLQPLGAAGELFIGGSGVAKGYLNNPALTAERFNRDFWNMQDYRDIQKKAPNKNDYRSHRSHLSYIYKTGDRARWISNGVVEFLGRLDHQVKIRGYRIELGEIENRLLGYPAIKDVAVIVREDSAGNKYLCAYIAARTKTRDANQLDISRLREYLSRELPDYMIPSFIVPMEKIPLTPNGKLDRKALPEPDSVTAEAYVAPGNWIEEALADTWSEILAIEKNRISMNANFFELGGHSLKATILISQIHKKLEVKVPLAELFKTPYIRGLSPYIQKAVKDKYVSMDPIEEKEYYDMSPVQRRLYALQQIDETSTAYNIPSINRLSITINRDRLSWAFKELIKRHESLRTSFTMINNEPVQEVHNEVVFAVEYDEPKPGETSDKMMENFVRPFDLSHAPLLRARLLKTHQNQCFLLVDMHHIISDAVSESVLLQDMYRLYEGKKLPQLRLQYKDYAQWQKQFQLSQEIKKQETYWLKQFETEIPQIQLPFDYPRPALKTYEGSTVSFWMGQEETTRLKNMALENGMTLYMVILAIYNVFLAKINHTEDIVVGSAIEGRRHPDLEKIVGMFVNTLALRNYPKGNKKFRNFLEEIKTRTLEALENQDYSLDDLVNQVASHRDTSRNPLFDVTLAFREFHTAPGTKPWAVTLNQQEDQLKNEVKISKFDLTLSVSAMEKEISMSFVYNTRLFKRETIELLVAWYENLLHQILESVDKPINTYHLSSGQEKELYDYLGLSKQEIECIYPLTPTQRDIYLDCTIHPDARAHRMIYYYVMKQSIEINTWRESLKIIHRIYPILRAGLTGSAEHIYFAIRRDMELDFRYMDLEDKNLQEKDIEPIIKEINQTVTHGIDRELITHYLLKISNKVFINILSVHHIIFDGPSLKLVLEKLHRVYEEIRTGQKRKISTGIKDHQTFINYQQSMLDRFDTKAIEAFWREKFLDVQKLQSPIQEAVTSHFVTRDLLVEPGHLENIKALCKRLNISVPLYFRGLYAWLIHFYFGAETGFIIREIFSGRDEKTQDFAGCFFHTIPWIFERKWFDNNEKISKYLQNLLAHMMKMRGKQYISILMQNRLLGDEDMTFYYNYRDFLTLELPNRTYHLTRVLEYSDDHYHPKEVQFITKTTEKGFYLELDYNEAVFKGERFLQRLLHVSQQVTAGAEYLADICFIMEDEKKKVLEFSTGHSADYPSRMPLYQLFSQRARQEPDQVALTCDHSQLTYGQLHERTDRLARHMKTRQGIKADRLVGVMMDRTLMMVESIMAVWKAGGAYIPIDPQNPAKRILQVLNDSQTTLLLSAAQYISPELQEQWHNGILCPDKPGQLFENNETAAVQGDEKIEMRSLAYVIYTSGSTGKPKGVMVEHIGMMNHIQAKINDLQLTAAVTAAQNASHTFDISVWQFFTPLAVGGQTVIYPNWLVMEPRQFVTRLVKDRVTILEVVPTYLAVMLDIFHETPTPPPLALDYLLVTGETLKTHLVEQWFRVYPGIKMVNAYGPTEASDDITHHIMDKAPATERIPIGKPLQNLAIYIVDENMNLCPPGIKGEICVAGIGVGRGYLNNPGVTTEQFLFRFYKSYRSYRSYIPLKLYKTGDLGSWLPEGVIDFFGRKDYQVKIRGFRIELGEIESKLLNHPAVKEAVVIDREMEEANRENAGKYLCAYIVSQQEFEDQDIKDHLTLELPDYMVPTCIIKMEKIPLTPNGKVDRKALPIPEEINISMGIEYTAPGDEIEQILVNTWEKVLGRNPIGIQDNFFRMGGDSIKAIQISSRLAKAGYKVEIRDIFQHPEIAGLAPRVKKMVRNPDQTPVVGAVPLTPIQKEFFTAGRRFPHYFNQAVTLYSKNGFSLETIKAVFNKIQTHHDALRMVYLEENGERIQKNAGPDHPLSLQVFDLREKDGDKTQVLAALEREANKIQASIDLAKGPLMKLALFHMTDGDRLLVVFHHLVIDGVSWRILFEDIEALYQQYMKKEPLQLPPKTDPFKLWAEKLSQYADTTSFLEQKKYWAKVESTKIPRIKKDFDHTNFIKDKMSLSFTIDENQTGQLLTQTNEAYGTEINDILLTALGLSIKKTYGILQVLIGLESHGREEIIKDITINRTVGWFTSLYPVILNVSYEEDLPRQIKEIKENLHRVPHKGIGYGILKYLTAKENKKEMEFSLKPQISFNYLGQFDIEVVQASFRIDNSYVGNLQHPEEIRKYELEISGMIANKRLVMVINYSSKQFKKETIETLLNHYKEELIRIISHCRSQEDKQLTPSDFTYKDLSMEELSEINAIIE